MSCTSSLDIELLTPRDAGRRLGITPSAVSKLCRRGRLQAVIDSSGRRLFVPAEIERLREERAARAEREARAAKGGRQRQVA